jgi:hypothetical protein
MSAKEKINTVFAKLPFRGHAEKIPAETRAKAPVLDKAIPFANHIACGLLVVLLATVIGCSRGGGSSGGGSSSGGRANPESDFQVLLTSDSTGAVIRGYRGDSPTVRIPATIEGLPVKEIGREAFRKNTHITSVVIPEGVTRIGNYAFRECANLSSVTLPSTLRSIGGGAFQETAIRSINLPAGLTEIGYDAFRTSSISAFPKPWPAGVTSIGTGLFHGNPLGGNLIIPEGVTEIGMNAFGRTAITSLTLPSTIKVIGNTAFANCTSLTTVNIPESVTLISFGSSAPAFFGSTNLNLASQARLRQVGGRGSF